jgi:hypothetical protein
MKILKILRKLLENEEPTSTLNLTEEETKWFEIGFNSAKGRFEGLIALLEEEE